MLRAALILIAALFLIAPNASADVRMPPEFTLHWEPCPADGELEGCAYPDGSVYVLATAPKFTAWHEIGHVYDFQILNDGDRAWFTRMFRIHGAWSDQTASDPVYFSGEPAAMPNEVFADEYAACALDLRPTRGSTWRSGSGFQPTLKRHRQICAGIDRVGRRRGATY